MRTDTEIPCEEIIFRPYPLGYLLALAGHLGAGVASLTLAVRHHPGWLAGAALVIIVASEELQIPLPALGGFLCPLNSIGSG